MSLYSWWTKFSAFWILLRKRYSRSFIILVHIQPRSAICSAFTICPGSSSTSRLKITSRKLFFVIVLQFWRRCRSSFLWQSSIVLQRRSTLPLFPSTETEFRSFYLFCFFFTSCIFFKFFLSFRSFFFFFSLLRISKLTSILPVFFFFLKYKFFCWFPFCHIWKKKKGIKQTSGARWWLIADVRAALAAKYILRL